MRLTTDFWVSALVKRVFGAGGFAAIGKRGATEAGAVFIIVRDRMGRADLYGPGPQTSYDSAKPEERNFSLLETAQEAEAIDVRLAKESRFDPDVWVVEIEPGPMAIEDLISLALH